MHIHDRMNPNQRESPGLFKRVYLRLFRAKKRKTPVYFISGMCYNCHVFDELKLPEGFVKRYIEWEIPHPEETLSDYVQAMARQIDTSRPFILVGYSFGAVIMQEMNTFLQPAKSVIISSFKSASEVPTLFQAVKKFQLAKRMPMNFFSSTERITGAFNQLLFHASNAEMAEYMTVVDPVYIKWAITQITDWVPGITCEHLYHIHGTKDQIFPYEKIQNVFPVEGGDHLMVFKKPNTISAILSGILLMRENE